MGKNGCGKTTLTKHINGLLIPTSGEVFIENINTKHSNPCSKIAKIISMTFQNADEQILTSTVEDEVAFGLENICFPSEKMNERIAKALDFVGLKGYEKRSTESLSGGQKQKLMLACALATEPKAIVLDEITSMLDPVSQRDIMNILLKINETLKTSIIMITHNIHEAVLAKKIMLMKSGEIKISGKPKDIFSNFEMIKKLGIIPPESADLLKSLMGIYYKNLPKNENSPQGVR